MEGWWKCSNAASDDVAPRIWQRQHVIMKSVILEEWLACQGFFHEAFSLKFLSSLARAVRVLGVYVSSRRQIFFAWMSLHGLSDSENMLIWALEMVSDAVRWQSRRGFNHKIFYDFFKKEIGALWTITVRRSIRTIPNIIVRCIKTSASVYNRYSTPDIRYCGMIRVKFCICVVWITTSWVLLAFGGVILIQGAW